MPIKASYCDAWYEACREDYFCGHGDYFECSNVQTAAPTSSPKVVQNKKSTNKTPQEVIMVLSLFGVATFILCLFATVVVNKEKQGDPLFMPLKVQDEAHNTEMT